MPKLPTIIIGKRDAKTPCDVAGSAIHFLKIDQRHFIHVRSGKKKAEFRRNDRDFRPGDALILVEMDKRKETGRFVIAEIDHVLQDYECIELPKGYAMLSIHVVYPDKHVRAFL